MASINLIKQIREKRRLEQNAAGSESVGSLFDKLKTNFSQARDIDLDRGEKFKIVMMVIGIASIFVGRYLVEDYTKRMEASTQDELAQVLKQTAAEKAKMGAFEGIKTEIENYQTRMRELDDKLSLIAAVKKNRNSIVRMVDFVVGEMPASVWLTKINIESAINIPIPAAPGGPPAPAPGQPVAANPAPGAAPVLGDPGKIEVFGYSSSLQLVSEFLKRLEGAVFFPSWQLVSTENETTRPANAAGPGAGNSTVKNDLPPDVKKFEINAKVISL